MVDENLFAWMDIISLNAISFQINNYFSSFDEFMKS